MKALSIRQPWAWLIANGYKDIENRTWKYPTKFRGQFLIHASKGMTLREYDEVESYVSNFNPPIILPDFDDLERGGIVGIAEITDCVEWSDSPWFFGKYGFVIENPTVLEFRPCKGQLGFFEVSK